MTKLNIVNTSNKKSVSEDLLSPFIKEHKNILLLWLIYIIACVVIFINASFTSDGYLSPDSTRYLALAQNLLDGNGFNVSSELINGKDQTYFATWPIGYSLFIFLIAKTFNLGVFVASKLVNVLFLGLSFWMIKKLFNQASWVYALVLLLTAYLELFSYSWSEVPFVFALLWFSYSLHHFCYVKSSSIMLVQILLACGVLFLSRYIGAFSFVMVGIFALFQLKKGLYFKFLKLSAIVILGSIFVLAYLYYNYLETGFMTGRERIPAFETNSQMLMMIVKAFLQEASLLVSHGSTYFLGLFTLQFIVLAVVFIQYRKTGIANIKSDSCKSEIIQSQREASVTVVLVVIAIGYYLAIISSRWFNQFDALNFRLISPGTLLIFLALINYIFHFKQQQYFILLKRYLLLISLFSVSLSLILKMPFDQEQSYPQHRINIMKKYDSLKFGDIVVFADNDIRYLRIDLILVRPHFKPFSLMNETVDEFIKRVRHFYPNKSVWIETSQKKIACDRLDPSWCTFIKQHSEKPFYEIPKL